MPRIGNRVVDAGAQVRAEALVRQEMVLQRERRRQHPGVADIDIANCRVVGGDVVAGRAGDYLKCDIVGEEVGKFQLGCRLRGGADTAADNTD